MTSNDALPVGCGPEGAVSEYADLINALEGMAGSYAYAVRKAELRQAARTIMDLERRLSDVTSAMHDGEQQRQAALRANRELIHGAADNLCEMQGRVEAAEQYAMDVRAAATRFLDEYRKEFYSGTEGPWSDPPDPLDVAYQALRAALATNTTSSAHARSVSEVARNDSGKPSERMEVSTPHEDTPRSDYALVPPATLAGDWGKALPICRHCGRPLPEGYDEKDCMANPNWASES